MIIPEESQEYESSHMNMKNLLEGFDNSLYNNEFQTSQKFTNNSLDSYEAEQEKAKTLEQKIEDMQSQFVKDVNQLQNLNDQKQGQLNQQLAINKAKSE